MGTFLDFLVILEKTKLRHFYRKFLECKFPASNNMNRSQFTGFLCRQVRIPYICGLNHNIVKNDLYISETTPLSCIQYFRGLKK